MEREQNEALSSLRRYKYLVAAASVLNFFAPSAWLGFAAVVKLTKMKDIKEALEVRRATALPPAALRGRV